VQIIDTGKGIAAQDLPHIFDRFYRADPSRSEAGFGLGLSIVRDIARQHGGNVEVSSIAGKGTTFTVTLPRVSC
jgi:two-component system sensor histidine kinase BaeS